MRPDMYKIIVERPRYRSRSRNLDTGLSFTPAQLTRAAVEGDDYDGGPSRLRSHGDKSLNEHLSPLERYLRKQLNRPWDKVYAEICATLDRRSAVGLHVLQHLEDFVAVDVFEKDGALHRFGWWGPRPVTGLYVHPRTGILRLAKPKPVKPTAAEFDLVVVNATLEFRKFGGLWFRMEYRLTERGSEEFKLLGPRVLTAKRQCDSKTIRKIESGKLGQLETAGRAKPFARPRTLSIAS